MEIKSVLDELDQLFSQHKIEEVERFLVHHIEQSDSIYDQVTLLNELIGYYRDLSKYQESMNACQRVMELLNGSDLVGSIPYATTLQNVANALRAAGQLEASMMYYNQVYALYEKQLAKTDMRYASLANNMSLLYQEMEDFQNACICLEKALSIVMMHPEAIIEVATTHTNLAVSLLKLRQYESAMEHIERALDIFECEEEKDFHYSGALAAMAEAKYMAGRLEEAVYYYQEAMKEIEANVGRTQSYQIMEQNLQMVCEQLGYVPSARKQYRHGLDLCEDFYYEYGKPMIEKLFPEYAEAIAVGLVGGGSDCFRFDDALSRDHDFGPGFCMWLTDAVYDEIGKALQEAYDALPTVYMGVVRKNTPQAGKRVGVFRIRDFYHHLIGISDVPVTNNQWLFVEDYQLASATNGKVFRDDVGEFTRIRKGILAYYPEEVYVKKVAREAALMAQTGQYNYGRMLLRKDRVTAHIALVEFIKHTMRITYLLNRSYAPFYKWQYKGLEKLSILQEIANMIYELQELPIGDEQIPILIEEIAALIIQRMRILGLTQGTDTYLDSHTNAILASIEQNERLPIETKSKEYLVDEIVQLEWKAFDQVENQGGCRAECQDNWETFSIMRKSQFLAWNEELLLSYLEDFQRANQRGWNLVTEKYGRMMCSTDPEEYEKLKSYFPEVSEQKTAIIEQIVRIQVEWMEDFAKEYPKISAGARSIQTEEDSIFNTSYETYLRGELGTYSDKTLTLYGRFIVGIYREHGNLAYTIIGNTAKFYGYEDLNEMEVNL